MVTSDGSRLRSQVNEIIRLGEYPFHRQEVGIRAEDLQDGMYYQNFGQLLHELLQSEYMSDGDFESLQGEHIR